MCVGARERVRNAKPISVPLNGHKIAEHVYADWDFLVKWGAKESLSIKSIRMETRFDRYDDYFVWEGKKEKSGVCPPLLHAHAHRREQFSVKITRGSSNELEKLSAHVSTLTIFLRGGS